jgi:N-acetyl-anhydromuramyl-L-alanine amidase AmpD
MALPPIKVEDRTAKTDKRVYGPKRKGSTWLGGVIHHTGDQGPSTEEGTIRWLSTLHANAVSVHKLIKRDGTIVKIVPEDQQAWCNGASRLNGKDDCNAFCISYELANRGTGEPYTGAQYEALAQSLAYDMALYHIADDWIDSHKRVRDTWIAAHPIQARLRPPGRKYDPLGLDWRRVWARIDEIRQDWPAQWGIPLWYKLAPRVVTT